MPPPFDGLRVLDLTTGIAGGYATKLLVDGGADALLVEPPGGDPLRRFTAATAPLAPGEDAPLFRFLRAGVASVDADGERLTALAAEADVVLATYRPGQGHGGGMDARRLTATFPSLVAVSISPWGTTGPWADRPATELTVQAACGGTARRGLPARPPVSAGGELGEWLVGVFAAVGAVTGWRHARRTGRGQHVDVSMLEAATLCLNGPYTAIAAQWHPELAPGRTIEVPSIEAAVDGAVGFCTMTAQQWADFCVLIGRPEWGDEPALRSADQRMVRIDELRAAIGAALGDRTVEEVVELGAALRVPVTPVGNGATVTGFDQVVARQVYRRGADGMRRPGPPYRLSATEPRPWAPAPALGSAAATWHAVRDPRALDASPGGRPFDGLKVVDLSAFWAGPFATLYLGAMGADVVKVESTAHPDGIRFLGGFAGEAPWERSMVFAGANAGKRDLTLDLEQAEGLELLWQLIAGADVLIENFTPRVLERFGIVWDDLHTRHPGVILVRMPAFGLDGPWRDRAGFAMTIEQTSGLAWVTGYEDLPLVPRGPCDPIGGMHAVLALTAALAVRERTGEGQLVEVPLLDGALNIAAEQVLEFDRTGEVLTRHGNRSPHRAPQGVYRSAGADRWVAVAVDDDSQWQALAAVLGMQDPGLVDVAARHAAHDELDAAIGDWTAQRGAEEAADILTAAGVPAAAVALPHLAHRNPQLTHRRFLQELDHAVTGRTGYPGFPMRFSAFGPHLYGSAPPRLGEHNREVLGELGLTDDDIAGLAERGVIGDRPAWLP